MKSVLVLPLSALLSFFLSAVAWSNCGTPNVCADVSSSLRGVLSGSNVIIDWDTDSEDSTLGHYEVYRFDCQDPECLVLVTTVTPTGTCNQNESYQIDDTPPSPVSNWTYQVRVVKTDASEQCRVNVVPE